MDSSLQDLFFVISEGSIVMAFKLQGARFGLNISWENSLRIRAILQWNQLPRVLPCFLDVLRQKLDRYLSGKFYLALMG